MRPSSSSGMFPKIGFEMKVFHLAMLAGEEAVRDLLSSVPRVLKMRILPLAGSPAPLGQAEARAELGRLRDLLQRRHQRRQRRRRRIWTTLNVIPSSTVPELLVVSSYRFASKRAHVGSCLKSSIAPEARSSCGRSTHSSGRPSAGSVSLTNSGSSRRAPVANR